MLSIYQGYAVSESLLREVARTRLTVDPVLFCYAICVLVALVVFTVAYLVLARGERRTGRRVRGRLRSRSAMLSHLYGG
jgi:hypothetical protein